jgi:RNA polymerase sigma-70 factor (ECF subfamily)
MDPGDADFETVYAETARPLRAYLLRLAGDLALADDVLQETYLRYLSMGATRRAVAPARPLLYRIATNLVYDHFRRNRRFVPSSFEPTAPASDGRARDVARALSAVKPRQRSLLWLAFVEGWSHAEIAELLGLRAGSVKVLLFRAKTAFARVLRERGLAPEDTE